MFTADTLISAAQAKANGTRINESHIREAITHLGGGKMAFFKGSDGSFEVRQNGKVVISMTANFTVKTA